MNAEQPLKEKGLRLRWAVVNTLGLALGLVLWGIISDTLGEHSLLGSPLASGIAFFSVGAVAGTLQWLALRDHVDRIGWGIAAGSIGYAIGFIAGFEIGGPPFDFIFGFILFALGSGLVQWRGLQRQVGGAGWWVPTNVLGLVVGGAVGVAVISPIAEAIHAALGEESLLAFAIVLALLGTIAGAVGGAISGTLLIRLLRQPSSDTIASTQPSPIEN